MRRAQRAARKVPLRKGRPHGVGQLARNEPGVVIDWIKFMVQGSLHATTPCQA
jgi:hypothetical protein